MIRSKIASIMNQLDVSGSTQDLPHRCYKHRHVFHQLLAIDRTHSCHEVETINGALQVMIMIDPTTAAYCNHKAPMRIL